MFPSTAPFWLQAILAVATLIALVAGMLLFAQSRRADRKWMIAVAIAVVTFFSFHNASWVLRLSESLGIAGATTSHQISSSITAIICLFGMITVERLVREEKVSNTLDEEKEAQGRIRHALKEARLARRQALDSQKALETALVKARSADQAKSEFLANVSHELRTPLNAIVGFSEALCSGIADPDGKPKTDEYVQHIYTSGVHLLELINNIIDLSQLEEKAQTLDETEFDLTAEIEFAATQCKSATPKGASNWEFNASGFEIKIRADRTRMRQVLRNVIHNAFKYSDDNGTASGQILFDEDNNLSICIGDTGAGMSEDEIALARERFGRNTSAFLGGAGGLGLGLPISIGVVELHGGELIIDSTEGAGTTVEIRLPSSRVISVQERKPLKMDMPDRLAAVAITPRVSAGPALRGIPALT